MGSYDSGRASDFGGISIEARRANSINGIRFDSNRTTQPSSANDFILYRYGTALHLWDGSSDTTLGSAGGLVNFSLNDAYDDGSTITVDNGSVTLTGSITSAILTVTNTSSGACIQCTQTTTTNKDINGTSSNWFVTGAGNATFAQVASPIIVSATSGNTALTIDAAGTGTIGIGATSTGAVTITPALTLVASATITGTEGSNVFTVTAGDLVVSDGSLAITDDDNAASLSVTNNTATTANTVLFTGSGVFSGTGTSSFFRITQSGLTTGTAFTVIANAATSSVGVVDVSATSLAGGSAVRVTGGGANMTSGGKVIEVAMGAATDGSGLTVTSTGTYVGAGVLQIVANSATSATGLLNVSATGLTSGSAVLVTSSTANFTTGGKMIELAMVAATAGNGLSVVTTGAYTGTGLIIASAGAMTTGVMCSLTSTTGLTSGSLIRATTSTAGALATNGVVSIRATGAYTSTSNIGVLDVLASATTAGTVARFASSAAGQTATEVLRVEASGFTTGYTGSVATFTSSSTTGAANVISVSSANSTDGTAVLITANSLTTGVGLRVTSSGTITSSGEGLVNIVGTGITTGDALKIDLTEATLNGGFYLRCYDDTAAATVFTVGEDGATVIAGTAIGTSSLTQTAGDHTLTSGNLILTAGHIKNTPQAIVNANTAISIVTLGTTIANNAGSTHTLADGTVGQLKYIVCTVYTADAVITPANFVGTTITLNAAGDSWLGVFVGTEWVTLALGGTAAVA